MKRLINEEEVNLASRENANNMYGSKNGEHQYFNASVSDFNAGVVFAEEKLKNLAIAFSDFILDNDCSHTVAYFKLKDKYYSPEQLFEKFLSTRE